MNEIPKELTPELLELVSSEVNILVIDPVSGKENYIGFEYNIGYGVTYKYINIDTLTRLMKEWLIKQEYMISVYHHQDTVAILMTTGESLSRYSTPSMTIYTEFEAVLKATAWVAKKKNQGEQSE